jgi:hypothetical protein
MKVGDLVKFGKNDAIGLIIDKSPTPCTSNLFHVQWFDGSKIQPRYAHELEIINESR